MNANDLKEYIKEDLERIEKILEAIGCHSIWRSRGEIRCAPPESANHTAISVNTDTLFSRYYSSGETLKTDLIGLVQHFKGDSFKNTFRYLTALLGLSGRYSKKDKVDPLKAFKDIKRKNRVITDIKEREAPRFGMEAISDYVPCTHISLFYEGITPQTAELFKVCYDPRQDRIIFPHFAYDDKDAIVGITGRTTRSNEEIKQFLIPKYWNYIKGYMKTWNLYGFSHSIEYVKKNKMLIIHEAEKSVQKHFTMTRNQGFSVSTGGHELSEEQVQIILQETPPDTEIVFSYDKDVMEMKHKVTGDPVGEEFLINTCKKISKYRKTSYIWDTYNILKEIESPIDRGYKIFHHLLKYRKTL
ncbi:hypothetical protein JR311_20285 (plasmid) [Bacillus velezensis]|uniref:hypothetical protein n=1 Tax=Bacillus velezensis TaxID=492670 RepID=UPI0019584BE7|nr:hypothetical protein [Bacillus velezensis]QRV11364.1 hypothetical protein JR311_20285 [Bacillus velezensis]